MQHMARLVQWLIGNTIVNFPCTTPNIRRQFFGFSKLAILKQGKASGNITATAWGQDMQANRIRYGRYGVEKLIEIKLLSAILEL